MTLHEQVEPSLDYAQASGLPRDLTSLMAYPYGVFDGNGWHWVASWDDVWPLLRIPG